MFLLSFSISHLWRYLCEQLFKESVDQSSDFVSIQQVKLPVGVLVIVNDSVSIAVKRTATLTWVNFNAFTERRKRRRLSISLITNNQSRKHCIYQYLSTTKTLLSKRIHTCWSILLHFDKVSPTLMVKPSFTTIVEQWYMQLLLQVTLHLTQLQSPDAICTIHRKVLLVIRAIGRLPGRKKKKRKGWFLHSGIYCKNTHTHPSEWVPEATRQMTHPYVFWELNERCAELLIVSFHCCFSIFTLRVLTAHHVVELWCGH